MPDLQHRLQAHDLGFLEIVAELWGVDLKAPDARTALPLLTRKMLEPGLVLEIVDSLPAQARQALDALALNAGWMPWGQFTRTFGALREVGPGKRDREKPYLDPISPTETLWYRGLIGRDFLRRDGSLQECAYIPDDLLELLPPATPSGPLPPGRAASPGETAYITRASDRILDHTCTLLAALRMEDPGRSPGLHSWQPPSEIVHALLSAVKLITSSEQPVPEDARPFLEMPRGKALAWMVRGWRESSLFNELHLMPGLVCDGAWHNDPADARGRILAQMSEVPEGLWWNLDSFVHYIFECEPDFQRPSGDFDTWLVRDAVTGKSLRGIEHWDAVDGALVRYLITGPMHWLGLIDLACPAKGEFPQAFRFSEGSDRLLLGHPLDNAPREDQPIRSFSDGTLTASVHTPRLARYQISRFCLWTDETETEYTYQLSPTSLRVAAEQGLKIVHLETLLEKYGETPPPSLIKALHQWQKEGAQVRIQPGVILRVEDPKILQALRSSPASRFLGDMLGPTTALIQPDAVQKVATALARLGVLSDIENTRIETDGAEPSDD